MGRTKSRKATVQFQDFYKTYLTINHDRCFSRYPHTIIEYDIPLDSLVSC